ncbi:MAG TPA: putative Ig domain-containing protein [Thermoanaerobaculia bacterium]|nr:putative Ig domain-containing protein [Thermoanaerobaculia bacterium]HXK68555.1 putative Ig domain-containing protein [Thermoanaerobaculia bacterium]
MADVSGITKIWENADVQPIYKSIDELQSFPDTQKWNAQFRSVYGNEWHIIIDIRSGRVAHAYGPGIPLVPGSMNDMPFEGEISEEEILSKSYYFISKHASLFNIDVSELMPTQIYPVDDRWFVKFDRVYNSIPVKGSYFFLNIAHGNIISFGTARWGDVDIALTPTLQSSDATVHVSEYFEQHNYYYDFIGVSDTPYLIPQSKNGDTSTTFSNSIGAGYDYILVWRVDIQSELEGAYRVYVDAHSGEIKSAMPIESSSTVGRATVRGGIFDHPHNYKEQVLIPNTNIIKRYNCYTSADNYGECCATDIPQEIQINGYENPTATTYSTVNDLYCTIQAGFFQYSSSDPDIDEGFQTRLKGPYVFIEQQAFISSSLECSHIQSETGDRACPCQYDCNGSLSYPRNYNYVCSNPVSDPIVKDVLFYSSEGDNSCNWTPNNIVIYEDDSDDAAYYLPTDGPYCGDNPAAITSFWHGSYFKTFWRSEMYRQHRRPFDYAKRAITNCSSPIGSDKSLLEWLTLPTKIQVNIKVCGIGTSGNEDGGFFIPDDESNPNENNETLCLTRGKYQNNAGEIPGLIYHEFGHGLDIHDPIDPYDEAVSQHSSEDYADIVAAIMTRDSCIADGIANEKCDGFGNPCSYCFGIRDIDPAMHDNSTVVYTPDEFIKNFCEFVDLPPFGPCGKQGHCESQISTMALWDFFKELTDDDNDDASHMSEDDAWNLIERLFARAIPGLGPTFFACNSTSYDSDGCDPWSLFMRLLFVDEDSDEDISNGTYHSDALFNAFNVHEIACAGVFNNNNPPATIISAPTLSVAETADTTVHLIWDYVEGAQEFDVMRNDLNSETAFFRVATVNATEYFDENVYNGETYWYKVVPYAVGSSFREGVSNTVSATVGGNLAIYPDLSDYDDEIIFVKEQYKRFPFAAHGGYGIYTWTELTGNIPTWLTLDANTGILSGTPPSTASGSINITIKATDTNDTSIVGTRSYVIKILTGDPDNLYLQSYLPPARAARNYSHYLDMQGGNQFYRVEIIEGQLPTGLYLQNDERVLPPRWRIVGAPTFETIGVHPLTFRITSTSQTVFPHPIVLDQTLYLAVINNGESTDNVKTLVTDKGSVGGGSPFTIYRYSNTPVTLTSTELRFINENDDCDSPTAYVTVGAENITRSQLFPRIGTDEVGPPWVYLYEATTPIITEGNYKVKLARQLDGIGTCANNTYSARAYGAVSNMRDYNLSILDTYTQDLLSTTPTVALDSSFGPAGLDFSKGTAMARYLFLTDQNSGDAGVIDMGILSFLGMIDAHEGSPRYRESDIAVDPTNDYAFVTHLTMGYPTGLPEPPDPISGGVTVLDLTGESCEAGESWCPYDADADLDPSTDSPGAPAGITRLYTETDLLLPLNIEILDLGRPTFDNYSEGEKYPGYYAFISGVGELAVNCLDSKCEKYELLPRPARLGILDLNPQQCKKVGSDPCGELVTNWDYWEYSKKILGPITLSNDAGSGLGNINQGLSFAVDKMSDPLQATVYAVNQEENRIYMIDYVRDPDTLSTVWVLRDTYLVTGNKPSDVSINTINDNGVIRTLAYVTNIEDGTVSAIDTATGGQAYPDLVLPLRTQSYYAAPTALDTHVKDGAGYGYTANTDDDTVTVFNLVGNTFVRNLAVGDYPLRIKIQPDIDAALVFTTVLTTLSYASPTDFTTPSKQPSLIRDWERVHELQETSSNSTAVLSNIDNFQNSVDKWITDEEVKAEVTQGVQLYRTVYLMNLP